MDKSIHKILYYAKWLVVFSFKITIAIIVSPFCNKKTYRDLWLIAERPDEARDNGYWLYKYIVEKHPEINVRYVLSKSSPDYVKMPRKELLIEPKSLAHYLSFVLCTKAIAVEMHGASPGKAFCIPFLPFMRKKQTIFLQHGVINSIIPLRNKLDLIVSTCEQEKRLLQQSNPRLKNNVQVLGLCRFDHLIDTSQHRKHQTILIMPTFRRWLRDLIRLKNAEEKFKKTEYYKRWNEVLNDNQLKEMIEQENITVVFYLHHELQPMTKTFCSNSKNVVIAHQKDHDVQTLLRDSALLVTDYSSVFFDFIYMEKPVLYYQFDQEAFLSKHYTRSLESYFFGDRVSKHVELINAILASITNGFRASNKNLLAANAYFAYHDQQNTQRNFEAIAQGGK